MVKSKSTKTRRSNNDYTAVTNNIYHDGSSYRVRVSVSGTKYSKNFSTRKQAVAYRNSLLGE